MHQIAQAKHNVSALKVGRSLGWSMEVTTILTRGNIKTSLSGKYLAFGFRKYAHR